MFERGVRAYPLSPVIYLLEEYHKNSNTKTHQQARPREHVPHVRDCKSTSISQTQEDSPIRVRSKIAIHQDVTRVSISRDVRVFLREPACRVPDLQQIITGLQMEV